MSLCVRSLLALTTLAVVGVASETLAHERDGRLVGVWERTVRTTLANPGSGPNFISVTVFRSKLAATGGYTFQVQTWSSPYPADAPLPRPTVTTGEWRTENGVLYARDRHAATWVALGRYRLSGNGRDVVITPRGGKPQLWQRR